MDGDHGALRGDAREPGSVGRMTTDGTEELLREVEGARLRSLVAADLSVAERLHAEGYELITPGGATLSKRAYLDGIGSGGLDYSVFEPVSEIRVRLYDRAAILRYRVRDRDHRQRRARRGHLLAYRCLRESRGAVAGGLVAGHAHAASRTDGLAAARHGGGCEQRDDHQRGLRAPARNFRFRRRRPGAGARTRAAGACSAGPPRVRA